MTKAFLMANLILCLVGCTDTVDTKAQQSKDSTALKSIDSSAIINDSSQLPRDSMNTTVTH